MRLRKKLFNFLPKLLVSTVFLTGFFSVCLPHQEAQAAHEDEAPNHHQAGVQIQAAHCCSDSMAQAVVIANPTSASREQQKYFPAVAFIDSSFVFAAPYLSSDSPPSFSRGGPLNNPQGFFVLRC